MFYISDILGYFVQLILVALGLYIIVSVSYSLSVTGSQSLSFPSLNSCNSNTTMFVMIVLLTSVYFADLDHSYQISESSFTYSFYSWLFQFVLLVSVTGFICISKEFAASKKLLSFEFDLIICFSLLGLVLINTCDDFLTLYIAIELQSLCFYVLATFARNSEFSTEAGIKYFVLGALSSGLLLFGFSLFYAGFGCLSFESIEKANASISCLMAVAGSFFFSVAILFKLGAFPFHMWLCDVYDGSILNVTAFFSVVPKAIMLGFFVKFVFVVISMNTAITDYLLVLAGLGSICFASVAALYQKRLKRLMAYSTVSHTGFLLIGMFCCSVDSIKACTIYIVLYILMTLSVFGVLFLGGIRNDQQRYLINWSAMADRNFLVAVVFGILLYSIAGIPPLAGFYSKLCILLCLLSNNYIVISVIIAIFSSVACFYYIRLVKILSFTSGRKSLFWIGDSTKHVEFIVALFVSVICLFLLRPSLLLNSATIAAISLM